MRVASDMTAGCALTEKSARIPTEVRVASIGIASIAVDRVVPIEDDRGAVQIESAMQVMPVIHSRCSQSPTA